LRTSLNIVAAALQRIAARPNLDNVVMNCFRDIDGLRIQASLMISDIDDMLEAVLKKRKAVVAPIEPKVSKRSWLWRRKQLEKKQGQIKDMMVSLSQVTLLLSTLCPWLVFHHHDMKALFLEGQRSH
jgi:hypothetical protein